MAHFPTVLLTTSLLATALAFSPADYNRIFTGDGTYYGGNPYTGNCAIREPVPAFYKDRLAIAMNNAQYEFACGACLRLWGEGKGLGADPIIGLIDAYVADRCPECKHGDLDLSSVGDGRWDISWELVPCPGEERISFQFEGSNRYYWKLQPRGMRSPVKRVVINGQDAQFTQDNHWVMNFPNGVQGSANG